ncbi:hypothetical protein [Microvirga solisilvae]|uniref:hypothetical protein n=1 Tax=Microvirga solisilvae TaxID=2919498 RepID=UPI001FB04694|nr:hypothetical protein [Microvirga solisilvae]
MIIWSGWGFLIVFIAALSGVAASAIPGPMALKMGALAVFAAVGTWALSYMLNKREVRVLVDPSTGEKVVLGHNDSLFFIPVRFWPYLILILGLALVLINSFNQ